MNIIIAIISLCVIMSIINIIMRVILRRKDKELNAALNDFAKSEEKRILGKENIIHKEFKKLCKK